MIPPWCYPLRFLPVLIKFIVRDLYVFLWKGVLGHELLDSRKISIWPNSVGKKTCCVLLPRQRRIKGH